MGEESMNDDTAMVKSDIFLSDSDDDEPLIKRPCNNEKNLDLTYDDDDLFGDVTAQDDLDLLAALENDTEADQMNCSMFTCPVCDRLLSHVEMNGHLDGCLS